MLERLSRCWARTVVVATVVAAAATTLTACGGESGGPTTLRFVWWGNEDRATATKAAVAEFEKLHPEIKVETEYSGYDAYFQKLSTQVAGGAGPDLLQLDRATVGEYEHRHVLADLTGMSLHLDKIDANLLAGGKVDGGQYAVPAGQTTQMLVFDPARFSAAGVTVPTGKGQSWNWAQFTDAISKVGAGGVAGTTDFGWAIDWFEVWLHQHGKSLYNAGKLGFDASDLRTFWTLTGSLRDRKGVTPATATTKMDGSTQNSALVGKQSASEINYDSSLTGYLSSYGAPLAAAPLPTDGKDTGMAAMPPVSFAVSQRSSHKDAAAKLLDFLVNDPTTGRILGATRGLPPNQDIRAQVCGAATGANKAVCDYEAAQRDKVGPAFGAWPTGSAAIKRDFQRTYDDVIFGRISAADAAERVVQNAGHSLS
ncbi:MAG TPA: extracellular solute-binding protein [Kutzneria sp.]